jgi:hypothetical protein
LRSAAKRISPLLCCAFMQTIGCVWRMRHAIQAG